MERCLAAGIGLAEGSDARLVASPEIIIHGGIRRPHRLDPPTAHPFTGRAKPKQRAAAGLANLDREQLNSHAIGGNRHPDGDRPAKG